MQSTSTRIRLARIGFALTAFAAFATGAAAGSAANVEPSEQRALEIRGKALNCKHARAEACMTDAEFRALLIRSEALNRRYGLGATD